MRKIYKTLMILSTLTSAIASANFVAIVQAPTKNIVVNEYCDESNDWYVKAVQGAGGYNLDSENCNINNSFLTEIISTDLVPATIISEFSTPPSSNAITSLDLSNVETVTNRIAIKFNSVIETIDLRSLTDISMDIDVANNSSLSNLNISSLETAFGINISDTSITDISSFSNYHTGSVFAYNTALDTFPSNTSPFCAGVRNATITFQTNDPSVVINDICAL